MSFQKRLTAGEFVVLAEMDTPKGVDLTDMVTNARRIKGRVDAVTIPGIAKGVMKMTALGGGVVMQQQGLEAIIGLCTRDSNRLQLQGDLLAAHVLGLQNLVVMPGEKITNSDHVDAKAVEDLDDLGLLNAISVLQGGTDLAGIDLQGSPSFLVGCQMETWSDEKTLALELEKTQEKVAAGARFVITPPIFDLGRLQAFMKEAKNLKVPIIPTVFLLKSVGVARYIAVNEPGACLFEDMIQRIRKASDRVAECVKIASDTTTALKEMASGVHLVTLGWEHKLSSILDAAGL